MIFSRTCQVTHPFLKIPSEECGLTLEEPINAMAKRRSYAIVTNYATTTSCADDGHKKVY